MTIRNKEELANQIKLILDSRNEKVDTPEKAAKLREKLSNDLADKIDEYVQFQIGTRLSQILLAVNASSLDGTPVPLIPGQQFDIFTRTR